MSDSTKAIVRRFYDLYNQAAWDELGELMSPGYVHHSNDDALSRAQFMRGAAWVRAGMPDFQMEIADMLAEGDRVAVRFVGRGTHLGSLYGETPTSNAVVLYGLYIVRIEDGLIQEDWEALDENDLKRQIGAIDEAG